MKKIWVLVFMCAVLCSCGPQAGNEPFSRSAFKHQNDIPVPLGYVYDVNKSSIEEFSSFRLCEMLYVGKPDPKRGLESLKNFYRDLMPKYDWQNQNLKSEKVLVFKKKTRENEYCRIEITRPRNMVSKVVIRIGNKNLAYMK